MKKRLSSIKNFSIIINELTGAPILRRKESERLRAFLLLRRSRPQACRRETGAGVASFESVNARYENDLA